MVEKLLGQLKAIQQGRAKDDFGWRESVREYKAEEYGKGTEKTNGHVVGQLP